MSLVVALWLLGKEALVYSIMKMRLKSYALFIVFSYTLTGLLGSDYPRHMCNCYLIRPALPFNVCNCMCRHTSVAWYTLATYSSPTTSTLSSGGRTQSGTPVTTPCPSATNWTSPVPYSDHWLLTTSPCQLQLRK